MNTLNKIFVTSGVIIVLNILLATFMRAWGVNIPATLVFSTQGLIIPPLVALYYWITRKPGATNDTTPPPAPPHHISPPHSI